MGTEVTALRTEFSRTRRLAGGVLETTLSSTSVNFRDGSGRWQAIDNQLERADGVLNARANSVEVSIPQTATGEVRFGDGDQTVAFSLVGSQARAVAVDGAVAEFAEVKTDADLSYEVDGRALKETITLASSDAPSVYRFAVDPGDLRPELRPSGDVAFVDTRGRQQLGFQAPWMRDADGAVTRAARYELERVNGQDVVVLRLDAAWLASSERSFPVVVDPTVYSGWEHVCEIRNGARSNTSVCDGALSESWVGRDSSGIVYRNLYELQDLRAVLPDYAQILDSWFAVYLNGQNPVEPSELDLHHLTRGFAPGVTWNRSDGRAPWGRSGGDFDPQRLQRTDTRYADPSDGWMAFDITELARGLVSGTTSSPNLLVKAADETRAHIDSFDAAEVKVRWHPRAGIAPQYTYESFELSDGSTLSQNVASGNLVLSSNDLGWEPKDGRSPTVRYFNSTDLLFGDFADTFGYGTQGSFGSIQLKHHWLNDSFVFVGPSGTTGVFQRRADGGFTPPAGVEATLTELPDGTFTLQYADTDEVWTFDRDGELTQTRQADGSTITIAWGPQRVETISDSTGRSATAGYDSAGRLRTLTDQAGAVHRYDYDSYGRLISYTNPTGGQTRYTYDSANRLTCIDLPDRTALRISYHGSTPYPSAITPVDAAGLDQPATSYDGELGWTSSERPATPRTVWFHDPNTLIVDLIQHGSDAAIATSGPIPSLHGRYTRGDTTLTVDVSAAQVPDGIQLTELEVDGVEVDSVGAAPCDQSTCPTRARERLFYDPTSDPEGSYEYRVNTIDGDNERTNGPLWTTWIDRTAPGLASGLDATLDSEDGLVYVTWNRALDPALSDSSPGSGADVYEYRYRVNGGTWSAPGTSQSREFSISGLTRGAVVDAEITAADLVGNEGAAVTLSDTVGESTATVDNPGDPTGESLDGIGFSSEAAPGEDDEVSSFVPESAPITPAAAYTENNCRSTSSPCGRYDGRAAAAYARYWWPRRNIDRYNSFGNDCTNFISQALYAGGMRFMRSGGYNDPTPSWSRYQNSYLKGDRSWWSAHIRQTSPIIFLYRWTNSWTLATTSHDRIVDNDLGYVLSGATTLRVGDLVYYRFRGSEREFDPGQAWTHSAIVTRVTQRAAWIAQHTSDYERTIGDVIAALNRSQGRSGVDWRIRFVRPTRAAYDID